MKKIMSLVAVTCLLSFLGCGGDSGDSEENTTSTTMESSTTTTTTTTTTARVLNDTEAALVGHWRAVSARIDFGSWYTTVPLRMTEEFLLSSDRTFERRETAAGSDSLVCYGTWSADGLQFYANYTSEPAPYAYPFRRVGDNFWLYMKDETGKGYWVNFVRQ